MSKPRRPRIDWDQLTRTTGTSRALITGDQIGEPTLREGMIVKVGGLKVQVTGISIKGTEVNIAGRVLRQVKRR